MVGTCLPQKKFEGYSHDNRICLRAWYDQLIKLGLLDWLSSPEKDKVECYRPLDHLDCQVLDCSTGGLMGLGAYPFTEVQTAYSTTPGVREGLKK